MRNGQYGKITNVSFVDWLPSNFKALAPDLKNLLGWTTSAGFLNESPSGMKGPHRDQGVYVSYEIASRIGTKLYLYHFVLRVSYFGFRISCLVWRPRNLVWRPRSFVVRSRNFGFRSRNFAPEISTTPKFTYCIS